MRQPPEPSRLARNVRIPVERWRPAGWLGGVLAAAFGRIVPKVNGSLGGGMPALHNRPRTRTLFMISGRV